MEPWEAESGYLPQSHVATWHLCYIISFLLSCSVVLINPPELHLCLLYCGLCTQNILDVERGQ